jgi:hypothetical protein
MPAGIIDQTIEPPMHLDGLVNDVFKRGKVHDIA